MASTTWNIQRTLSGISVYDFGYDSDMTVSVHPEDSS